MVHSGFKQLILKRTFLRHFPQAKGVIDIPIPQTDASTEDFDEVQQGNIVLLERILLEERLPVNGEHIFVIESNYSYPGANVFCQDIFTNVHEKYPHSMIIAYSGTEESLVKAAKFNDQFFVCHSHIREHQQAVDVLQTVDNFRISSNRVLTMNLANCLKERFARENEEKQLASYDALEKALTELKLEDSSAADADKNEAASILSPAPVMLHSYDSEGENAPSPSNNKGRLPNVSQVIEHDGRKSTFS